jgi:hypothetical protein
MQVQATDTNAGALFEQRGGLEASGEKRDAMKRGTGASWYAKRSKVGLCVRHQAFPTGFVNGRVVGVGDQHIEALLAQSDRGRKTGWTTPGDQGIATNRHLPLQQ